MRSRMRVLVIVFLLIAFAAFGQQPPAPAPAPSRDQAAAVAAAAAAQAAETARTARLPLRRVVLYKNGIGYFEHLGRVRGAQDVTIDFTSAQLNDVLKSLTALDLGAGRVTGVNYNSDAPLSRRLGALRLPLEQNATPAQFWNALRGARLEVRSGTTIITGRLLALETRTRTKNETEIPTDELSLISDAGDFRLVELTPGVSVRVLERELATEVGRYLDLIGSTRAQDLRRMTISTAGSGERPLFVSYISEVPVWKTTYRLVLPSKPGAKPLLQGWAIVDNTVGEDWTNVELSLVAGAPQSFIQEISQPYYSRRPVVPLPESAQLTPQTHQAALTIDGQSVGDANAVTVTANAPVLNTTTSSVSEFRVGTGAGAGKFATLPALSRGLANAAPMAAPSEAMAAMTAAAQARELGDLFEYKLKELVTIRKNQSAMAPIINTEIAAEKISLWNESMGTPRPLRGLWLANSSALTLDGGSFSVLDDETFAGEGLLDAVKPGEKRLLSYATDLGMIVSAVVEGDPRPVTRVRIARGVMTLFSEQRALKTYTARNEDTTPRSLIIEHPVRAEWKFARETPTPAESTATAHRFRVPVEPKKTATLAVRELRPIESRIMVGNTTDEQIKLWVAAKTISPQIEEALRRVVEQKNAIASLDAQASAKTQETNRIFQDQERLRENMKALKGSAEEKELLQRYTRQLNEQENRLEALRKEQESLAAQRVLAQASLDKLIMDLSFDVTL